MNSNDLIKPAAKSGLTLGLIGVIITLLIYFVEAKLLANIWVGIGILVTILALVLVFGIGFRKQCGGFLSFKHAFFYSLIVLLSAGLVNQAFNYLLFNVIDPELVEIVADAAIENTQAVMEKFNLPDEEVDKALENTKDQIVNQYTIGGIVKTYFWSIIVYAIISLITGAIIKRNDPQETI